MSRYERVALGSLTSEYSERNRALACTDVYSVTNSEGFTPSTEYFSKEVFSKNISSYKIVRRGMFAYNPSRVNVGSVSWLDCKDTVVISPMYVVFNIDEGSLCQSYLNYFLHSDNGIAQIRGLTSGSVRDTLKYNALEQIQIPLPSLETQRQIAAVLDKTQSIITARHEQIAVLDKLAKDLFVEMFGDPVKNPNGWDIATIRELVTEVKYGTSKPSKVGGKYTYLRMNNITYDGEMDFSDVKHIDVTNAEYPKYVVMKGDLLFNRTNSRDLVGKTAVFREGTPMIIAGYIIRVRLNEKANPDYVSGFLNSKYGKTILSEMCKGIVGQANINAQELQDIRIVVPPIDLQDKFAKRVKAILQMKTCLTTSLAELETLYKSLTQQAFAGELFSD